MSFVMEGSWKLSLRHYFKSFSLIQFQVGHSEVAIRSTFTHTYTYESGANATIRFKRLYACNKSEHIVRSFFKYRMGG